MRRYVQCIIPLLTVFMVSGAFPCSSDVIMPYVFGDNMVLQRDKDIMVWGTASPQEKVLVEINGNRGTATAGKDGRWMARLRPLKAGGPYTLTVTGKTVLTFGNVMIGEVWLCSGQSNMWLPLGELHDIPKDVEPAANPDIRLFSVWSPENDSYGKTPAWTACGPETLGEFSAVAYFFGRRLQAELHVPVGLIHSSMGGSVPEAWMTRKTLDSEPLFSPIVTYWDSVLVANPGSMSRFEAYLAALALSKTRGNPPPADPNLTFVPKPLRFYMRYPEGIYNAQLAPLIPFTIRGVIWYQGESSISRAWQYRALFPMMILEWRKLWGQGNFPFLYVQISGYRGGETIPELRESQLVALSMPNTAMVVTVDIGEPDNVHANDKWDVGGRLALAALNTTYGRDIVSSGPLYRAMTIQGNTARLQFDHAEGLRASGGAALTGFEIAGEDRIFHPAVARIQGNEVVVSGERLPHPVAVRYGWSDVPKCNLYNAAGLPASPFRTDTWPGITDGILVPDPLR